MEPTPTLGNIVKMMSATPHARAGVVKTARRQSQTPPEQKFFSFFYQPCLTAMRDYIALGCRGRAFESMVDGADTQHASSFHAVARGLKSIADALQPTAAKTGGSYAYVDGAMGMTIRVRTHLKLTFADGSQYWCFVNFGERQIPPHVAAVAMHAVALVASSQNLLMPPMGALVEARRGTLVLADAHDARNDEARERLHREVEEFRRLWDEAEE